MANNYPTSLNSYTGSETLSAAQHAQAHNAYESKIGIGASTPVASSVFIGTGTGISAWTAATGTGTPVLATSPTLTTPVLGVATATSINKVVITAPATSATLTLINGTTTTGPAATGTLSTLAGTETFTNKRVTKRTGTVTSSATPTINTDNVDFYSITALATAITSMTTNLSGTPTEGQTLWIAITDNGTARALTFGASFEASGNVPLPTTTVISTRLDIGFVWNTVTSKWRVVAVS